jgi:CBS domain-containing protein
VEDLKSARVMQLHCISGAALRRGGFGMPISDYCEKPVVTVAAEETVRSAAQRMRLAGVGSLPVMKDGRAIGIVTDRDLVLETLCKRLDAGAVRVGEIATGSLVTIDQGAPVRDAVRLMRRHAVRRLPVVDDKKQVVGIVAADDLVGLVANEITALALAIRAQTPAGEVQRSES